MSYETVIPASADHVDFICANMWERGVLELAGLGLTVEQWRSKAHRFIENGESAAILFDGVPVCVIGLDGNATWFQATDGFLVHFREITKQLRKFGKTRPDTVIHSQCIHPKTAVWFRRCGFEWDGCVGATVTGKPLYRFRRADHVRQ
jgi:hypothetical protein